MQLPTFAYEHMRLLAPRFAVGKVVLEQPPRLEVGRMHAHTGLFFDLSHGGIRWALAQLELATETNKIALTQPRFLAPEQNLSNAALVGAQQVDNADLGKRGWGGH